LEFPIHMYRAFGHPPRGARLIAKRDKLDEQRKVTRNKLKGY
jgi:hypothetical protein